MLNPIKYASTLSLMLSASVAVYSIVVLYKKSKEYEEMLESQILSNSIDKQVIQLSNKIHQIK